VTIGVYTYTYALILKSIYEKPKVAISVHQSHLWKIVQRGSRINMVIYYGACEAVK
jgi:hypothetical protein